MAVSDMLDLDGSFGLTDVLLTTHKGTRGSTKLVEDDNYGNIFDLDTRLNALDGTTYSVAMLRTMTKNDKVYALRVLRDPTTIK